MFLLLYFARGLATETDATDSHLPRTSAPIAHSYDPSKLAQFPSQDHNARLTANLQKKKISNDTRQVLNEQVNLYGFVDSHIFLTRPEPGVIH